MTLSSMTFSPREPQQQAPYGSPVVNDKPFSAGCVFWFAVIGFALTCLVVFGGRGLRSMLPADFKWSELLSSIDSSFDGPRSGTTTVTEFQNVTLAGKPYRLEVARTDEAREQGLSDRLVPPVAGGMRFIFDKPDRYTFWMHNMHFSIDIVFLNNGTIVNIASKVPYPKTPNEEPAKITPPQVFNEVIELPAGDADKLGLKIGQRLQLP